MNDHKSAETENLRLDGSRQDWAELVRKLVSSIRFGSVVITIHDARVVQVDKVEKMRLDHLRS